MGNFLAVLHARRCPDILAFWKDHSIQYPILSRIALDFLSVPVSGVGPENLFSVARDVCHYRRNRLGDHTIEAIMVQLCTDRSVIDEEYQQLCEEIDGIDDQALSYGDDKDLDTLPEAGYISDEEGLVGDDEDVEEDYFRSTLDSDLSLPSQPTSVARSLTPPPAPVASQAQVTVAVPASQDIEPERTAAYGMRNKRHQVPAGYYRDLHNGA